MRLHIYWAWGRVREERDRRCCPLPSIIVSSGATGSSVALCWLSAVIELGWQHRWQKDWHKPTVRHG